jgi:hypothetical protein
MKKLLLISLCSVVALAAVGGLFAVAGASTSPTDSTRSFSVIRKITQIERQQAVPGETSVGDRFEFTSDLKQNGNVIGHQGAACTVLFVRADGDEDTFVCSGTWTLPGGMITAQAYHTASGQGEGVAITGGTGIYRHARGQIGQGDSLPGDRVEFTFELS